MIDWYDPEARADLIERVGSERYNELWEKHRRLSTICRIGGHSIRAVRCRFGRIYMIENGDAIGFQTLGEAIKWCRANPIGEPPPVG